MTEKKSRGRPEYVPDEDTRKKVRVLKAGGMSNEAIAEAIGISHVTLSKYFSLDLEVGAAKVTAEILMARYNSAVGGNVTAQNKWLDSAGAIPPKPKAPKATAKGKKEVLAEEAQVEHAGQGWGALLQ